MDIETITKLLDAGYTKDEIKELESAGNESDESAGNEGAGNESEGNESEGDAGAQSVNTDAAIKALTDTVNALTNTVKAMQEKNANSASGGKPEKSSVDEVLKSFVDSL